MLAGRPAPVPVRGPRAHEAVSAGARLRATAAALAVVVCACASVSPKFSQDVATGLVQHPMRRLESQSLVVYYPAPYADAAGRIAERLERCHALLREASGSQGEKVLLILTATDFNNAYVQPTSPGFEQQMVAPLHVSLALFDFFNLGDTAVPDITCHELVHYVQFQQNRGLWGALNLITGGLLSPQSFMEDWFLEGIATYYESRMARFSGRLHSPVFRGSFLAGVASQGGELRGGDLSAFNRTQSPYGAQYLVGAHFVDFLARRYGEERLWQLVNVQAYSIAPPLVGTLRFAEVYGKTIGGLLDEWNAELRARAQPRARPPDQTVLDAGPATFARLASAPDGALALVAEGLETAPHLKLFEPDGRVRFEVGLTPMIPPRRWIGAGPITVSGLDFTPDGRWLYLLSADIDAAQRFHTLLWRVDARDGRVVRIWDGFSGLGGCLAPDGASYVFAELGGGTAQLVRLDLATGERHPLTRFDDGVAVSAPACAADGRIAFVRRTDEGFQLALRETDGSVRALTRDRHFNYSPRWLDAHTLLFLRGEVDSGQAYELSLLSGALTRVTDAPFVVLDPVPLPRGRVAFINRDGWGWTLDVADRRPRGARPGPDQGAATPALPVSVAADGLAAATPGGVPGEGPSPNVPDAPQGPRPDEVLPRGLRGTPPPDPGPLAVQSDEPYSQLDHLFYPRLRAPGFFAYAQGRRTRLVGLLSLQGSDRLGFHTWAANFVFDSGASTPTLTLGYGNDLLAPWFLALNATLAPGLVGVERSLELSASRAFWTTPVLLGLRAVGLDEPLLDAAGRPISAGRAALVGPRVAAAYRAGETTPYRGLAPGLGLGLDASFFPGALGGSAGLPTCAASSTSGCCRRSPASTPCC